MCYCTPNRRTPVCNSCATWLAARNSELQYRLVSAESAATLFRDRAEAAEAKVDALMIEYCPDEMTQAQLKNWALNQLAAE